MNSAGTTSSGAMTAGFDSVELFPDDMANTVTQNKMPTPITIKRQYIPTTKITMPAKMANCNTLVVIPTDDKFSNNSMINLNKHRNEHQQAPILCYLQPFVLHIQL